eukprot:8399090-Pyramimonas_sp.AAC.1
MCRYPYDPRSKILTVVGLAGRRVTASGPNMVTPWAAAEGRGCGGPGGGSGGGADSASGGADPRAGRCEDLPRRREGAAALRAPVHSARAPGAAGEEHVLPARGARAAPLHARAAPAAAAQPPAPPHRVLLGRPGVRIHPQCNAPL